MDASDRQMRPPSYGHVSRYRLDTHWSIQGMVRMEPEKKNRIIGFGRRVAGARQYLWPQLLGRAPDIDSSRPLHAGVRIPRLEGRSESRASRARVQRPSDHSTAPLAVKCVRPPRVGTRRTRRSGSTRASATPVVSRSEADAVYRVMLL